VAATDDNAGTGVPPTADTPAPAAPKKRASRAAKPDPEALAAEIEKTREDLADTLDAIAEKVSPKRVAKRTTKKVTSAVKDTAHDAASAVKDTASSAKEKVSGGRSEQSWAPPAPKARPAAAPVEDLSPQDATHPLPLPSTEAAPVPADIVTAPAVSSTPEPAKPWYAPPAAAVPPPASGGSLVRPEYIAVGAAAALVAWFLVRRRR
jgi:hypothetical protein